MAVVSNTDLELLSPGGGFGGYDSGGNPILTPAGIQYKSGAPAIPALYGGTGANKLVTDGWDRSKTYADTAFLSATNLLAQLATIGASLNIPPVDVNLIVPTLDISSLNYLLGVVPTVPSNTFAFAEVPYSSNLLTDLRAQLLLWVDGKSTGLLPSVEQAIWDRGRAREVVVSNRKAQEAVRSYAMRGFSKPPGALSLEIQDAVQEAQNTSVTLSRDVMIKQAELEQSNRRFSFEQAGKMEEALIAYTDKQAQRVLDAAREYQAFKISIYQQQVNAFGVQTQAYSARVGAETTVFKALTDVQVSMGNLRLEAARINVQMLIQRITLTVEAMKASAQVSAQLCASALSSISLSGGIHDASSSSISSSASNSAAQSLSVGFGANIGYSYSGPTPV